MLDALVTLVGLTLLAVVAVTVPSVLRIRGRVPFAVAMLVAAAGEIVLVSVLLSPVHGVVRGGMLAAMAAAALLALGLWTHRKRPLPPRPALRRADWRAADGATRVTVIVAALALLVQLYVLARVAPSNWDSMTYHLSRAAYWLQYHSVGQYPGASVRQTGSAPDAEILQAWTMLVTGTDRWVELVQWVSLVGLAGCIFAGARMLRFGPSASAFAAALFVILPMPILQSTTTQNDVVVSFFIAATALFTARGVRDRNWGDLAIAGASLGLAIGTKGTALLALPSLGVIAIAAVVAWRPPLRLLAGGVALAVAGVAAFGAYNYVLNLKNTNDVFGGVKEQVTTSGGPSLENAVAELWTFADAPGVDASWIEQIVQRPAHWVLGGVAAPGFGFGVDSSIQEDLSAYGLVGFLVLPLILLFALVWPRGPSARRVLALCGVLYFAVFAWRIANNPWLGRVFMPGVALAAPLFALAARRPWIAAIAAAAAIASLAPSVFHNPLKPLLVPYGSPNVFAWSRSAQMGAARSEMAGVIDAVQAKTGPHAALGFAGGEDSWDYPYFGARREHRVERILNPNDVTYARMARDHLAGVLFANLGPPPNGLRGTTIYPDYYWVAARGTR